MNVIDLSHVRAHLACPGVPEIKLKCGVKLKTRKICKECERKWNRHHRGRVTCDKCDHTWPLRYQSKNTGFRWCPNCGKKQHIEDEFVPDADFSAHFVIVKTQIVDRNCLKCDRPFKAPKQFRLCSNCRAINASEVTDDRFAIVAGNGRGRRLG
jgi:Zn finger protein HypA/HybF involved in hydrogenase expression